MHAQYRRGTLAAAAAVAATISASLTAWAHTPPTFPVDPPFSVQATANATVALDTIELTIPNGTAPGDYPLSVVLANTISGVAACGPGGSTPVTSNQALGLTIRVF